MLPTSQMQLQNQSRSAEIPDWALPSSPIHKQVPPPSGFHRPTRTEASQLGIFEGPSDIGGALIPGASLYDAAARRDTIRSAGYNIWYNRDEFRFVWRKMSGDISLAADASFPDGKGYDDRKAVLVLRLSLDDDSAEVVVGERGTGMIHIAERDIANGTTKDAAFRFGYAHRYQSPR